MSGSARASKNSTIDVLPRTDDVAVADHADVAAVDFVDQLPADFAGRMDHRPPIHADHALDQVGHEAQVVGDHDDGHPPVDLPQDFEEPGLDQAYRRWPSARPGGAIPAGSTAPGRSAPAAAGRRRGRRSGAGRGFHVDLGQGLGAARRSAAAMPAQPAAQPRPPQPPHEHDVHHGGGELGIVLRRAAACSPCGAGPPAAAGRTPAPRPRSGCNRPSISRSNVVLPPPLGPTMQTDSRRRDRRVHVLQHRRGRRRRNDTSRTSITGCSCHGVLLSDGNATREFFAAIVVRFSHPRRAPASPSAATAPPIAWAIASGGAESNCG